MEPPALRPTPFGNSPARR